MNTTHENLKLLDALIDRLQRILPLTDDFKNELIAHAEVLVLEAKQILVRKHSYSNFIFFVVDGLLIRCNGESTEMAVSGFYKAGDCAAPLSGLYGKVPTLDQISTCTDTTLIAYSTDVVQKWYECFFEANVIMRRVFEQNLALIAAKSRILRLNTVKQKFEYYKKIRPEYIELAPIDVLASFFNVKKITLERVMRNDVQQREVSKGDSATFSRVVLKTIKEKLYVDPALSLHSLAEQLQITPHALSTLINIEAKMNFPAFIAGFRVAHVVKLLQNPESWMRLKLESIGYLAGFKSRSSFYYLFKLKVGLTPIGFMKQPNCSGITRLDFFVRDRLHLIQL